MDLDPLTGGYDDRFRWYNSTTGDFFNRDPAAADINLYRYCGNDPLINTDPDGLEGWGRSPKTPPTFPGGCDSPGYDFWVYWIVPKPATNSQQWQVTMFTTLTVSASPECHVSVETSFKMDVHNIKPGEEIIPDEIGSKRSGTCLMLQTAVHYVGFSGFRMPQGANVPLSASDAARLISLMKPPVSIYVDTYLFVNKDCCCPLLKNLLTFVGVPDCNSLWTGGVTWPKPKPKL